MEGYAQMKAEMRRCGIKIGPEDPKRFSRLIETLQRGNYDCAKILSAFADIEDTKRLRQELDHDKQNLEARLDECREILPLAEQLLHLGINFDQAIAWIETIHECAEAEKIDYKAAAYRVLQDLADLRLYRYLGSLQRNIQQLQQYLAMLNMLTAQKQQALMILQVLQGLGVTIDEIYGLSKILDLRRLGNSKQWPPKDQESFASLLLQLPSQLQHRNGDNNTQNVSQWLTTIGDEGRTLYK